jgi:hypothetical protein
MAPNGKKYRCFFLIQFLSLFFLIISCALNTIAFQQIYRKRFYNLSISYLLNPTNSIVPFSHIFLLEMFFTSRMNFMIIKHDLKISRKKECWSFFAHFWGRLPFDPKIFAKKCPFKLKNWLLRCFCMGNPKKVRPGTIC